MSSLGDILNDNAAFSVQKAQASRESPSQGSCWLSGFLGSSYHTAYVLRCVSKIRRSSCRTDKGWRLDCPGYIWQDWRISHDRKLQIYIISWFVGFCERQCQRNLAFATMVSFQINSLNKQRLIYKGCCYYYAYTYSCSEEVLRRHQVQSKIQPTCRPCWFSTYAIIGQNPATWPR